ncbi:MAG: protein phosphatase 2C domain-containing protein [archaeon]|nr:protein phosphatase 2C domain-containing protein [archaeon]
MLKTPVIKNKNKRSFSTHLKGTPSNRYEGFDQSAEMKRFLEISHKIKLLNSKIEKNTSLNQDSPLEPTKGSSDKKRPSKLLLYPNLSNKKLLKSSSVGKLPLIQSHDRVSLIKLNEQEEEKVSKKSPNIRNAFLKENSNNPKISPIRDNIINRNRSKSTKKIIGNTFEKYKLSPLNNPIKIKEKIDDEYEDLRAKENKSNILEENIKNVEILSKTGSRKASNDINLQKNSNDQIEKKYSQDVNSNLCLKVTPNRNQSNKGKNINELLKQKDEEGKTSLMLDLLKKAGKKIKLKPKPINNEKDKINIEPISEREIKKIPSQDDKILDRGNNILDNAFAQSKTTKKTRTNSDFTGLPKPKQIPKVEEKVEEKEDNSTEIVQSYEFLSQAGKNEEGEIKTNQDSYLVKFQINGIKNFHMFGVLDGHGENGHFASSLATSFILSYFENAPELKMEKSLSNIYKKIKDNDYDMIKSAYKKAEKSLSKNSIDFSLSGTTCVICFIIGKKIICSNVGDSRAIVVSQNNESKNYSVKALSRDHKPTIEEERKRIESKGGMIQKYIDTEDGEETGPFRVWQKDSDGENKGVPGLAMSRSIGDLIGSSVGVEPLAEIREIEINEETKFLIVASDGIWEFLDDDKVMNISKKYYETNQNQKLCKTLVKHSTRIWEKEDTVRDDITCVSVFF